jgi:hypothetical protein
VDTGFRIFGQVVRPSIYDNHAMICVWVIARLEGGTETKERRDDTYGCGARTPSQPVNWSDRTLMCINTVEGS